MLCVSKQASAWKAHCHTLFVIISFLMKNLNIWVLMALVKASPFNVSVAYNFFTFVIASSKRWFTWF
jgi:hypothetical protein